MLLTLTLLNLAPLLDVSKFFPMGKEGTTCTSRPEWFFSHFYQGEELFYLLFALPDEIATTLFKRNYSALQKGANTFFKSIPNMKSKQNRYELPLLDGWMTCDFTSFSSVFQSYQDDGQMIMKGCVQWNPVYGWEDFASSGDRTRDR